MDKATVLCGLSAFAAALPALDAWLRLRRLSGPPHVSAVGLRPARLLAIVPSRAEGARVGEIAGDLKRESEREIVSTVKSVADVLVLLDGPDTEAVARLERDRIPFFSKKSSGPTKGHALAFAAASLGDRLDAYDFILVFDADMRLPEGFFRDLAIPPGTEAFQLPVRPAGTPGAGAARVEALSLAEALQDDLARDAEGLPVRLRGKAMGFSPRAFRLGPAAATRTTVEDSEATLRLLAAGIPIRALDAPFARDEPSSDIGGMARSRSRWFGGHMRLFLVGIGDLARIAVRSPKGAFVLACDLWFRPRLFVLLSLAILAGASDVLMLCFSMSGKWSGAVRASVGASAATHDASIAVTRPVVLLIFLLLVSFEAKLALVLEGLSLAATRRVIGYPPEVPTVSLSDLSASLGMWIRAAGRALLAPSRWHRARPPR